MRVFSNINSNKNHSNHLEKSSTACPLDFIRVSLREMKSHLNGLYPAINILNKIVAINSI